MKKDQGFILDHNNKIYAFLKNTPCDNFLLEWIPLFPIPVCAVSLSMSCVRL